MGRRMDRWVDKQLLNQAMSGRAEKRKKYKLRSPRTGVKEEVSMDSCLGGEAKSSHQYLY